MSRAGAVSTSTRTDRSASGVGRKHASLLRDRVCKEEDYKTVDGMVMVHLGHVPRPDARFEWEGFSFEVVNLTASAIAKTLVAQTSGYPKVWGGSEGADSYGPLDRSTA